MSGIVKKITIKQTLLAFCFALLPLTSFATGLGKLTVFSALGEPLNAEIELLAVTPEELLSLTASLASDEQYVAQGIDKTAAQRNINASISKKPNGSAVIQLTSSQAVTDPFLDMLIQVVWSDGQLSREYTLLLDPAEYSPTNVASPVVDTPKAVATQSSVKNTESGLDRQSAISRKSRKSVRQAPQQEVSEASSDVKNITTVKGDSLSALVKRVQIQDVNLDQLLIGVYEANKSAFVGGNINRLKVGQVISIPSAEVLQAIDKDQAKTEVRAQVSNWHNYSAKLADAVSHSESGDGASNQNSGKIVTKAEDKAAAVAEGPRDVVKLAKTTSEKPANASDAPSVSEPKKSEQAAVNLQDDLAAQENTIKETDEKSAALEKQIADMKKLLAVKNKSMADVQKNAETSKQQAVDAPSVLDVVDPVVLSVGGGLVALLLALWLWMRQKNKAQLTSDDSFANNDLTTGAKSFLDTPSNDQDVTNESFLSDFSSSHGALIDTHEVDPIAEAEVFLTYGRQAQAEDILKDAIQKTPERYELYLKLLGLYAEAKNVSAFELLAVELFSQVGSSDPIWAEVSELGLTIDPENKLYHRAKDAQVADAAVTEKLAVSDFNDAGLMDVPAEQAPTLDALDFHETSNNNLASEDTVADFSDVEEIDFTAPDAKALEVDLADISLSFEAAPQVDVPVTAAPIPDAFNGDFSNLLKVDTKPQAAKSASSKSAAKANKQKSESHSTDSANVATKLELASAYIDMADKEGALELLKEALEEGGPEQRARAQALIDSLA